VCRCARDDLNVALVLQLAERADNVALETGVKCIFNAFKPIFIPFG
jgi:hypothetical protein